MNRVTRTVGITTAIFLCALVPPIGALLLILLLVDAARSGHQGRRARQAAYDRAVIERYKRRERERILAWKSMP